MANMKPDDQIKALAELDGFLHRESKTPLNMTAHHWIQFAGDPILERRIVFCELPPYLTSYDAIIPLIQKQHGDVILSMCKIIAEHDDSSIKTYLEFYFKQTPAQLAEALLRATGKWIE